MAALRAADSLMGMHLPGGKGMCAKVAAYADDMTLFLTSDQDFEVAGRIVKGFCEASGARVNVGKSSVMFAGRWADRTVVPGSYNFCVDGLKILGIKFFRRNSAQENWEAKFKAAQMRIARWKLRGLSMWGRLEVVRADLLPSLNYLAYVFPVPFWYGRKLERMVFSILWKKGTEMVTRAQMYCHVNEGGRGVPCIPLKMEAIFFSSSARLATQEAVHKARFLAQFWLAFPLRSISSWRGTMPWSTSRPAYYQRVADFVVGKSWCLDQSLILQHKQLYSRMRDELVEGAEKVVPPYRVSWAMLQPSYLTGFCKDLNWLAALGRLPVRERLYRHGSGKSPRCPGGCGLDETVEHTFWSCPGAVAFWKLVMAWWERWGGPKITRNLVLYGEGLGGFVKEGRRVIWVVVSERKHILWEWRTECLRKQTPHLASETLFLRLLGKIAAEVKAFKYFFVEEKTKSMGRLTESGGGVRERFFLGGFVWECCLFCP